MKYDVVVPIPPIITPNSSLNISNSTQSVKKNVTNYIIFNYTYPVRIAIQVFHKNDTRIESFAYNDKRDLSNESCGANKLLFYNETIQFVFTSEPTCEIKVNIVNCVEAGIVLAMEMAKFWCDNKTTLIGVLA